MGFFLLSGALSALTPNAVALAIPQETPAIESYSVSLTGYNAVPDQTDGDPSVTASGAYSNPELIAARSRDLAKELPFGTVIALSGPAKSGNTCGFDTVRTFMGYRVIADSMNERIHNTVDILFDTTDKVSLGGKSIPAARALGVCEGVTIYVVGHIDPNHIPKTQKELAAVIAGKGLALK